MCLMMTDPITTLPLMGALPSADLNCKSYLPTILSQGISLDSFTQRFSLVRCWAKGVSKPQSVSWLGLTYLRVDAPFFFIF